MIDPKMSLMTRYICCVPVSPLRQEASHRSELVTQQLFGETCGLVEKAPDHWVKVRGDYDHYEGWCQEGQIKPLPAGLAKSTDQSLTADWSTPIVYAGQSMVLPMGCPLAYFSDGILAVEKPFPGRTWNPEAATPGEDVIRQIAFPFLNTSYLWGGKSVFGIDCSGLAQTVFKFMDIKLQRDASQQINQGIVVPSLSEARCGDLAFFDNADGRITHVGILLSPTEIIHASVKVRLDDIDERGIIHRENGERTHRLAGVRRNF